MTTPQRGVAVYSVHTTRPDGDGSIEIIFGTEDTARAYAQDRSTDHRVRSASVTRYLVGELGTRRPVTWFVDGVEQPRRYDRPLYPTDGADHVSAHPTTRSGPRPDGRSPCANS